MNSDFLIKKEETLGFEVRTKEIEGKPWFVLADVCKCLYIQNTPQMADRLKESGISKIYTSENTGLGVRKVEINLINEANLYRCVLRSNKKEAELFQDWIVEEVLPSIRKTGMYAVDDLLNNPDFLIKLGEKLKADKEAKLLTDKKLKGLSTENLVLSDKVANYNYRELINSVIKKIAKDHFKSIFSKTFTEFYKLVNTKLHINLNTRFKHYHDKYNKMPKALMDMFRTDDEWRGAARLALAWARYLNVDTSDIMYDKKDIIKGKPVIIKVPLGRIELPKEVIEKIKPKTLSSDELKAFFNGPVTESLNISN